MVDFHPALTAAILDVSKSAEAVHKETYTRTGGPNHLRQGFLVRMRYGGLRSAFELGEQQESARQPLLTGIEEVVDQVCLHQCTAGQKKSLKEVRERLVRVQGLHHFFVVDSEDRAWQDGRSRSQTQRLRGSDALLADKAA